MSPPTLFIFCVHTISGNFFYLVKQRRSISQESRALADRCHNESKYFWSRTSSSKVQIFWEGHKILRNLHCRFDRHYIGQIYCGDFAKFCGLLRIYELYLPFYWIFINFYSLATIHGCIMSFWQVVQCWIWWQLLNIRLLFVFLLVKKRTDFCASFGEKSPIPF